MIMKDNSLYRKVGVGLLMFAFCGHHALLHAKMAAKVGNFINIVFNFIILALVVFIMVKQINRVRRENPKAPAPPEDVLLLREIRDSLKK